MEPEMYKLMVSICRLSWLYVCNDFVTLCSVKEALATILTQKIICFGNW